MKRAATVFDRRPDMGLHDDAPATACWEGGTKVTARHANGHVVCTDMPQELGGGGGTVTPGWLLRAGFASCAASCIGMAAAAEFHKILDHNGIVQSCWTGALARLGLARANALEYETTQGAEGDAAHARSVAAYKDFLNLWKDADPEIPIYKKAKDEYAKLQ